MALLLSGHRETGMRFGRQSERIIVPIEDQVHVLRCTSIVTDLLTHVLGMGQDPILQPFRLPLSPGSGMSAAPSLRVQASSVGHPPCQG